MILPIMIAILGHRDFFLVGLRRGACAKSEAATSFCLVVDLEPLSIRLASEAGFFPVGMVPLPALISRLMISLCEG